MSIARVYSTGQSKQVRLLPVEGGKTRDGVGEVGHTSDAGHKGIDIYPPKGQWWVRASTKLEIIRVVVTKADDREERRQAGPIYIDAYSLDDFGIRTGLIQRYLHLAKLAPAIAADKTVEKGAWLGDMWHETYNKKAGHLHFEIRTESDDGYGEVIDPISWLRGDDKETRQTKLVMQIGKESEFPGLQVAQTLYAQSGQRLEVTQKGAYPWLWVRSLDSGSPKGEVTADMAEAADWAIEEAEAGLDYSWQRDGIFGAPSWRSRIKPLREQLDELRGKPVEERYKGAREAVEKMRRIRGQSFIGALPENIAATVGGARAEAQKSLTNAAGSFWDTVTTETKYTAAAIIAVGLVGYLALRGSNGK